MALTRSFLKGMGLTDEQVGAIIEAHTDTTDALKEQRDSYRKTADKLPGVQKELDELKANKGGDDWEDKYNTEHQAFEDYKSEIKAKEANESKSKLYKELLKATGVGEKYIDTIMNVTDLKALNVEEGKLKDSETLTNGIKEKYSGFIVESSQEGANTNTPPNNDTKNTNEDLSKLSMEDYIKARTKK